MQFGIFSTLLLASAATLASCQAITENIFVTDYAGNLHTVQFTPKDNLNNSAKLNLLNSTKDCGSQPSWLFKGPNHDRLWCVDESYKGNGSLNGFEIGPNGALRRTAIATFTGSPVQASFAFNNTGIFVAVYSLSDGPNTGGGVRFYPVGNGEDLTNSSFEGSFGNVTLVGQYSDDVHRAHGVATDPSEKYVAVPDLGADQVRFFERSPNTTIYIKEAEDLMVQLPPRTKPRHALFFRHTPTADSAADMPVYLFVVGELSNTITTINITYAGAAITEAKVSRVTDIFNHTRWQNDSAVHSIARAAEIKVGPENKFLTVSNRNITGARPEGLFDSLHTYSINGDGSLQPVDYKDPGFSIPRGFEIHPTGDKVLVTAEGNSTIFVYGRDNSTGKIGDEIARLAFDTNVDGAPAGVSHAIWDFK